MNWSDEMQRYWTQQQPSHESHERITLSDDDIIEIYGSEFGDGDPIIMTTDTYGEIVAGKVTKVPQISKEPLTSEPFWTRIGPALCMNEARWIRFTTHLKKKCSGDNCPILHVIGVGKSREEAMVEGIALSVKRRHYNPYIYQDIHEVAAEAIQAAIEDDLDRVLELDQVGEVLAGLDENFGVDWTATGAEYQAAQEAFAATTHVSHVSSVEIMRSELGLETIEIPRGFMEWGFGLTYNDHGGRVERQQLGSVMEWFGKADQMQVFASVYDMASKTKMCNHVCVDKIRKCKDGYRLYLRKDQIIASTTMTGKSKRAAIMTLYGYNKAAIGEPPQSRPVWAAPVGAAHTDRLGRPLLKVEPGYWLTSKQDVTVSLDTIAWPDEAVAAYQSFFLSSGHNMMLSTVKSVERDGSKTMVTFEQSNGFTDNWDYMSTDPYLTIKRIPMAMPGEPLALKLTLTATALVEDQEPVGDQDLVAETAEAINDAIGGGDMVDLADLDELLGESELGVTGVGVSRRMFGYGQTKSTVVNKIGATICGSSDGIKTYIDIDPRYANAVVYKSTLKDGGAVAEEHTSSPLTLQLEHMRAMVGQEAYQMSGQEARGYEGYITIVGVDGVVKCDREKVSKVLRKKKGGRCIYRIVVDHGKKVKTTHLGEHSGQIFLDEMWAGWE